MINLDDFATGRNSPPPIGCRLQTSTAEAAFRSARLRRVDGMYLRILVHDNQHMGQLIAYARMSGVNHPGRKSKAN